MLFFQSSFTSVEVDYIQLFLERYPTSDERNQLAEKF